MPKSSSPYKYPSWPVANKTAGAVPLDLASYCAAAQRGAVAPIDSYYEGADGVLERSRRAEVATDGVLLRLLVMEVVSATELFFRTTLAALVKLCPEAATTSANRPLTLSAVSFYGADPQLGILDGISLAAAGELARQTKNLTGFDISPGSPVHEALAQFEKVCQIRHAVAHSGGYLGARNVAEIAVVHMFPCVVSVDALRLQEVVAVAHNTVRAYNIFLLERTLDRWISRKRISGSWRSDRGPITALLQLFHSTTDMGPLDARKTYDALRGELKAQGRL